MKRIVRHLLSGLVLTAMFVSLVPTVALGATISNEKWYVRVYNVDDIGKVYVNGNLIKTVGFKGDSGWVDITTYVLQTAGNTKIRFTMYNKLQGYTWGFQIAKALPPAAKQVVWSTKAGTAGVVGANNNDQTKPNRTVYDKTVYIKDLGSSYAKQYTSKYSAFTKDARWANGTAWGYYQKPKLSTWGSIGCCAYGADFCTYVFGKTSYNNCVSSFTSVSGIRAGDVLHINNSTWGQHWIVVLTRSGNTLYTAEGNYSGKVRIGNNYTISGTTLKTGSLTYTLTRGYHMQ